MYVGVYTEQILVEPFSGFHRTIPFLVFSFSRYSVAISKRAK